MLQRILITFCLCAFVMQTNAQTNDPSITAKFDSVLVRDFITEIEKQSGYFFYFDSTHIDSLFVDITVNNEPLPGVLDKALSPNGLSYAIDRKTKKVYLSKDLAVQLWLPKGLYKDAPLDDQPGKQPAKNGLGFKSAIERAPTAENKLYEIGNRNAKPATTVLLNGTVRNARTGEPFPNISILIDNEQSVTTDAYGNYSITIKPGKHSLNVIGFGIREALLNLAVHADGVMNIDVQEQMPTLKEVIVSATRTRNVRAVQMGVSRLSIAEIKQIPSLFGEADILRAITTLPGVKTVGEASTGFNVRGGSADQNLILFNESTIYNPSHFFGMFSSFNPEIVKDIELYKSSMPAKYGGRLSSVLDINSREGNKRKISGSAGTGPITSRIQLEGPLVKDKTSFILGGRSTYANWLINLLPEEFDKSRASFQDLNLGLSHNIDSNNNIYINGYYSRDRFTLNEDTAYQYNNRNLSVKWKRSLSRKLQAELIGGYDYYRYQISSESNEVNAFKLFFDIRQLFGKLNFVYYQSQKHAFDFGLSTVHYKLNPGSYEPAGSNSLVRADTVDTEYALENAAYLTHRFNPNNKLAISTGIRYSYYSLIGPQDISYYLQGQPRTGDTRTNTVNYAKGKFINNYHGPEIRVSLRYAFTPDFSVKASYNTQRQYIHLLSNTTSVSPTDIWKLSDPNIRPQIGDQASLGFYKNLRSNTIETSVEVYYRNIKNYLDYKPGALLLMNDNIETDVINTKGKAYGLEVLIKKPVGKLNGWIGYTYSRILLKATDETLGNLINDGNSYPANYDKPHDFVLAGNFKVNHRFSLSVNSTYSTGRPITYPIGRFNYGGSERVLYSNRNQYRIPDYYRTDFSMNIDGNHKVHQKTHNSWTIGVYNLLGRRNPYSVYFVSEQGGVNGYKLSIFGSAIPFINYNIRF